MNAPFIHSISVSLSEPITTRLQSYEHILNKDLVNVLNASIKNVISVSLRLVSRSLFPTA